METTHNNSLWRLADIHVLLKSVFNSQVLITQPHCLMCIGTAVDEAFVVPLCDYIKTQTQRGQVLSDHPLKFIMINQSETPQSGNRNIDGIELIWLNAKIGYPENIHQVLRQQGISEFDGVLYLHLFTDKASFWASDFESVIFDTSNKTSDTHSFDASAEHLPVAAIHRARTNEFKRWASLLGTQGLIVVEVHDTQTENIQGDPDISEVYFNTSMALSRRHLLTADAHLICAATAGLFVKPMAFKKHPEIQAYCRISMQHFEKRNYCIRYAQAEDLPALLELENVCWAEPLRITAKNIQVRLDQFPEGNFVLEMEGQVAAVIYTQRIHQDACLMTAFDTSVFTLHHPEGAIAQLVKLNVLPEKQQLSLGDQLLEFVLLKFHVQTGIECVQAVTRCRDYSNHRSVTLRNYINMKDSQGRLIDPILRFHQQHGAQVKGLISNYRPYDEENDGNGVLIEYDIRNYHARTLDKALESKNIQSHLMPDAESANIAARIETAVLKVLGEHRRQAYMLQRPLMEMGLDSLDLSDLRVLLEQNFNTHLDPVFFFKQRTTAALQAYFENASTGQSTLENTRHNQKHLGDLKKAISSQVAVNENPNSNAQATDLAIVGMACRFPGGVNNPDEFWSLLAGGRNAIREVPNDRWEWYRHVDWHDAAPAVRRGGFINDIAGFDTGFFRISPKEAELMDPQQRYLLELSWETLESAGYAPATLSGSKTGVYIGVCHYDYREFLEDQLGKIEAHLATGNSPAILANRLSYFYNFNGPSLTIDTACSSSLVALHEAARAIHSGECQQALAGGVNLICSPTNTLAYYQAGMLADDAQCKTFDSRANGYVRGEGAGLVMLKSLAQARADNDNIYAIIKATAVNHGGEASSLTAPNPDAQAALLVEAYRSANISPETVGYIEAHGTGTELGDPIEVEGLKQAFRRLSPSFSNTRSKNKNCGLGSLKTNIGHLESAAGIAGLIKTVLAMQNKRLPSSLNFKQLNSNIDFEDSPFYVVQDSRDWLRHEDFPYRAGVSSFGFGGANAHAVLEEAPQTRHVASTVERPLHLLALSSVDEPALQQLIERYRQMLHQNNDKSLADISYTAAAGRNHFSHRITFVAENTVDLIKQLDAYQQESDHSHYLQGVISVPKPRVAFLFTGQGAQYPQMGRELYETQPQFKEMLDRCAEIFDQLLDKPLLSLLWGENTDLLNETQYTQPTMFVLEYCLAQLWLSWGVKPDFVMGHSVGEYAAACIAGVFSFSDGLTLMTARGHLMAEHCARGAMLSVFATSEQLEPFLKDYPDISIAAENGPLQTVVSGASQIIKALGETLKTAGIRIYPLQVSHGFHSALMEPMLDAFQLMAERINYKKPHSALISNVTGQRLEEKDINAQYWVQHVRQTVRFKQSMQVLEQEACEILIEIGPRAILIAMGQQCITAEKHEWLPSLQPGGKTWQGLLNSLARCYIRGLPVNWQAFDKPYLRYKISLPLYPFQRQRYWYTPSPVRQAIKPLQPEPVHPLLGHPLSLAGSEIRFYEKNLNTPILDYLQDHIIAGQAVMPASAYVELALAVANQVLPGQRISIENMRFYRPLPLDAAAKIQNKFNPTETTGVYHLEIWAVLGEAHQNNMSEWILYASAEIVAGKATSVDERYDPLPINTALSLSAQAHYQYCRDKAYHYGEKFQAVKSLQVNEREVLAHLVLPKVLEKNYHLHPVLLDAAIQLALPLLKAELATPQSILLPASIGRLTLLTQAPSELKARVRLDSTNQNENQYTCHIELYAMDGMPVAKIAELRILKTDTALFEAMKHRQEEAYYDQLFYRPVWQAEASAHSESLSAGKILLFYTPSTASFAHVIAKRFSEDRVLHVQYADENNKSDETHWKIRPADATAMDALIQANQNITSIYFLGGVHLGQDAEPQNLKAFQQQQAQGVMSLFYLIKSLDRYGLTNQNIELKVITNRAFAVDVGDSVIPWSGALFGLTHVFAKEFPEVKTINLDLDFDVDWHTGHYTHDNLTFILREPATAGSGVIAFRKGQRYVRHNEVMHLPSAENENLPLKEKGAYLILGGAGGIGFVLSRLLAEQCQARLVWVGRSELNEEKREKINTIKALGGEVLYCQADGSDLDAMRAVYKKAMQQFGSLHGVVHSALFLQDRVLPNMDEVAFNHSLAAKVQALWVLHELVKNQPLDFMLIFSSCLAFYGNPGQSNYVAGCTFKDGFAHYLKNNLGVPAKVINWGYWGSVGAVASEEYARRLHAQGFEPIEPLQGEEAMRRILASGETQVMAVKANREALHRMGVQFNDGVQPLQYAEAHDANDSTLLNIPPAEILFESQEQANAYLQAYLKQSVAEILRLPLQKLETTAKPFKYIQLGELGLDSLLSMDLRNRLRKDLHIEIPVQSFIGNPVNQLVDLMYEQLLLQHLNVDASTETSATDVEDENMETFVL